MKTKVFAKFSNSLLKGGSDYSFINLTSISHLFDTVERDISYFVDGFLLCFLFKLATGKHVDRVSFDFTSIASDVFEHCANNSKSIYFIGANRSEISLFVDKMIKKYPSLIVSGFRDGYFNKTEESAIFSDILSRKPAIVVAGLGAGKQEYFIKSLRQYGFEGTSFTCGGFIRQESMGTTDYYPYLVNKLSLRAFYRMYKEPHTVKRYLIDYPKNAVRFLTSKRNMFDIIN